MLEKLRKYENLGDPIFFWELLSQLKKNNISTMNDISEYFHNKIICDKSIFDGCIPLLLEINVLYINEESNEIKLNFDYQNIVYTEQMCSNKLLEIFLINFSKDETFYKIFSTEYCHYDLVYKGLNIDFAAFGLNYASIRNLFLDFNFLLPHPDFKNKLIINSKYKKLFDKNIAHEIKKRKIGISELEKQKEYKQINGDEAELFVLNYEKERLLNKDGIDWIAPYECNAGFDVISYDSIDSIETDRFIEVKSYSGAPYFYWSRNEMDVAKIKGDKYYLYLFNRDDSQLCIIQNPNKNILDNPDWRKDIYSYFIYK